MKKLLALTLALCLALLPTLSLAEGLLGKAIALEKALTTLTKFETPDVIIGVEEIDSAIRDLAAALTVSSYAQQGQLGLSAALEGSEVFSADLAIADDTVYVQSPWLGQDTLAFTAEQLQALAAANGVDLSALSGGITFDKAAAEQLFSGDITELLPQTFAVVLPFIETATLEETDEAPYSQKLIIPLSFEDIFAIYNALLADLAAIAQAISLKINGQDAAELLAAIANQLTTASVEATATAPLTILLSEDSSHAKISYAYDIVEQGEDGNPVTVSYDYTQTADTDGSLVQSDIVRNGKTEAGSSRVVSHCDLDLATFTFNISSQVFEAADGADEAVLGDLQLRGGMTEAGSYMVICTEQSAESAVWATLTVQPAENGATVNFSCGEGSVLDENPLLQLIAEISSYDESLSLEDGTTATAGSVVTVNANISVFDGEERSDFWVNLSYFAAETIDFHVLRVTAGPSAEQPLGSLVITATSEAEGSKVEKSFEIALDIPEVLGIPVWLSVENTEDGEALTAQSVVSLGMGEAEQAMALLTAKSDSGISDTQPSIVSDQAVYPLSLPEAQQQETLEAIAQSAQMHLIRAIQALPVSTLQIVSGMLEGE